MRNLILILVIFLTGCNNNNKYTPVDIEYTSELSAVVAFYKSNYKLIESLTTEQELLGYVLKCGDTYKYTNAVVGGMTNKVTFDVDTSNGCDILSLMHTHPLPPRGMTSDVFSQADLDLSEKLPVYLFTLEKHILRVAKGDHKKWGLRLGTINL